MTTEITRLKQVLHTWFKRCRVCPNTVRGHVKIVQRRVLKLCRSLEEPIPRTPHNYQFIAFDPETHADAWLELNNFIFAHHPDQGNWVMKDLENRMQESWFDPQGFFLCLHNGKLAGFCWTKIHRDFVNHDPIGELYVIGVDPNEAGKGQYENLELN